MDILKFDDNSTIEKHMNRLLITVSGHLPIIHRGGRNSLIGGKTDGTFV